MKIKAKNRYDAITRNRDRLAAAERTTRDLAREMGKRIDAETKERERVEGELATANRLIDLLDDGLKRLEDRVGRRERGYVGRAFDRMKGWVSR